MITDLSKGIWRRVYAGLITGKRINSVSDRAELLFIRLMLLADDFGNLTGDVNLIRSQGFPRRQWTTRAITEALEELLNSAQDGKPALVVKYDADGDTYLHLTDFEALQPAGKNGRRVRRHPLHAPVVDAGESKGIRVNPGGLMQSSPAQQQAHKQAQAEDHSEQQQHADADRSPPPGGAAEGMRAQAEMLKCLFACGFKRKAAEEILILPGCTAERVAVLWHRIKTASPPMDNPAGFMRTGIEQAWTYTAADAKKAALLPRLKGEAA